MDRFFASSSSAAQAETRVSSSSTSAQPARQLSSIDDVRRWLATLTEVTSTQKLESLRAAVKVLQVQNPKRDDVRPFCSIWGVKQTIKKDHRPPQDIILDLKGKVIEASNELKLSLAEHAQIRTDTNAQPAEPPQQKKRNLGSDSAPKQPAAKAKPTTRQQKRKQDSPALVAEASDTSTAAQPAFPQSKTQRLTHFGFECRSGPVIAPEADVVGQDGATETPKNSKILALRRHEMNQLYLQLKLYRDSNPNTPGIEDLIKKCKDLRVLPCTQSKLNSQSIKSLYISECGALEKRADDDWTRFRRQDYTTVSFCACDGLQYSIAQKSETWETVDAAKFPILFDIQSFFHSAELNALPASSSTENARSTYWMPESRQQLLTDLRQLVAAPTVPFGSPSRTVKFLGGDVFHSLKMLAQLEMPDACSLTKYVSMEYLKGSYSSYNV